MDFHVLTMATRQFKKVGPEIVTAQNVLSNPLYGLRKQSVVPN